MTPEEQRLAIARACGWRIYKSNGITYYERPGGNVYYHALCVEDLPDYLNDLNAIHEAEKILDTWTGKYRGWQDPYDSDSFIAYYNIHAAWESWLPYEYDEPVPRKKAYRATAVQRAEALLKTLDLWNK